ncbi:MAG: VOC family protein, partial [Acetobacteraceae bacterium]|nr:VOC family protein [Acetobacteraceae bacterium]
APEGLNGLVFGSEDAQATYAALRDAGVPVEPPEQFSRPVALPDGARDATFRTVRLSPGTTGVGRLYFCQHLTRDLVWRDEWRRHPNGVIGVIRAVIAAREPAVLGNLFARMFGDDTVRAIADGFSLAVGLSRFDVLTPEALQRLFGGAAPDTGGREEHMAALSLRTKSLDTACAAFQDLPYDRREDAVIVPAAAAFGVTLEFRE